MNSETPYREIPIGHGFVALIDEQDFELVSQYKWHLCDSGGYAYAKTTFNKTGSTRYMHRLILGLTKRNQSVRFTNGNGLDCRRNNLELVTFTKKQFKNVA